MVALAGLVTCFAFLSRGGMVSPSRVGSSRALGRGRVTLSARGDTDGPLDAESLLARELDAVLAAMKARSGAQLNLTDQDFEEMRARGASMLESLGADIDASYANVSAQLRQQIEDGMAEQRIAALNDYNMKTAGIQNELRASQAQVKATMNRVEALQKELNGQQGAGYAQRAATSAGGVAIALGLYNGGVGLWQAYTFSDTAGFANVAGDGVLVLLGCAILLTLRKQDEGGGTP